MINGTIKQDEVIETKNNKPWLKFVFPTIIVALLTWFSAPTFSQWFGGVRSFELNTLLTTKAFTGTLVRDIAVSGKIIAANAPKLYSPEPGQVTLLAKPGDKVAQGDIVAQLASPELKSLFDQETAQLQRLKIEASRGALQDKEAQLDLERSLDTAQVRLNASLREYKRADISSKQHLISELELVNKEDATIEAKLLHRHAKKRVELAKQRLQFENQTREFSVKRQQIIVTELERRQYKLDVRAPLAGIVGNWLVQQKERVGNTQAIMTIVDLSQYEAELSVPEFYADDLGLGLNVMLNIGGKQLIGQISSVSPEVNNSQVAVRVSIVHSSHLKLRQNQRLNARIEFEKKDNVLMVKRGAFLKSTAGKSIFVINNDYATRQPISIGSQSVEFVEITSGLTNGQQLIISSYDDFELSEKIKLND